MDLEGHLRSSSLLSDLLLCPICVDVFTDPVTTPCGHNLCKSCLTHGEKLKALKSCLDCGLSFCKIHLEPHYHVPKLKKHKLINPVENLEANICQKHERVQDRLKKIKEIKHSVEQSKRSTAKEKADSVEVFIALIRSIERSQAELPEMMEEKQKAAERKAEGLIKELEQEISVLKRRDTELERLSHTEEHLHLLQIYSSMCSPPHTKNWTEISINTDVSVDTVRTALSQLQQSLNVKLTKSLNDKLKKTVMNESEQSRVTTAIAEILKDISSSVLQSVVETLNSLGVSSSEDFRYVQEADLLPILRPIQARKLVSAWSQISNIKR
ncbi:tripartite motif-containing protein 29-like [Tachysurus vachellii]|uniref:tripartite motif-containing protein 29-like n=1 Tax=Tachysurus vachellii TaxID=175792 RepID=UPI00296AB6BB|nr:tripartite motif-containing protein 29-like [Tachysurus vachellii]